MAQGIGRNGELFRELCEPGHLIRSALSAARGKRRKRDVASFLLELEPECFRLARELREGSWTPGEYHSFWIREPKRRLISAAPFRDRVVHHALVSLLEPHFEKRFIAHSYACRVGKGTHRALLRASELSRTRRFVLKGDLVKFFPSLDHDVVKREVRRAIADELGYLPISEHAADLLFQAFSERHERGSVIVNSNLPFAEWAKVFRTERLAVALLDRITHRAHILEMNGESYRLKSAKRRSAPRAKEDAAS